MLTAGPGRGARVPACASPGGREGRATLPPASPSRGAPLAARLLSSQIAPHWQHRLRDALGDRAWPSPPRSFPLSAQGSWRGTAPRRADSSPTSGWRPRVRTPLPGTKAGWRPGRGRRGECGSRACVRGGGGGGEQVPGAGASLAPPPAPLLPASLGNFVAPFCGRPRPVSGVQTCR